MPETKTSVAALIIPGSGPTDRDGNQPELANNSLKYLAENLTKNGIATLRYDKRAIGKSNNNLIEENIKFEHYIEDAKELIKWLKNVKKFSKVYVIGHSEGSLIGMIAAREANTDGFISIAGAAYTIDKIIIEQTKNFPEEFRNKIANILHSLKSGQIVQNVSSDLYLLFLPSVQPYLISWMKYNPVEEIKKLKIPILIIHGTNDIQISIENAHKLSEANNNSELAIVPEMNHVLKNAEIDYNLNFSTYMNPNLPISDQLVSVIIKFINN